MATKHNKTSSVPLAILQLSWRQTWNRVTQNGWAIAGSIIGVLYGFGFLMLMMSGMVGLRLAGTAQFVVPAILIVACVLGLSWVIINIFFATKPPLSPEQFCLLPVRGVDLAKGAFLAHLFSVQGVVYLLLALCLVIPFTTGVVPTIASLLCAPLAAVVWLLTGRVVADGLAAKMAHRKTREMTFIVLLLLFVSSGYFVQLLLFPLLQLESPEQLLQQTAVVGAVLQWVPFAAPFAAAASFAAGNYLFAALQLALTLVTIALLFKLWQTQLTPRLTAPVLMHGTNELRANSLLDRMLPQTVLGALMGRLLRYQLRDPRHLLNLCSVPLVIILFSWIVANTGELLGSSGDGIQFVLFCLIGFIVAVMAASVGQLDSAYDGETLVWHNLIPVRGKVDRRARILAKVVIYVPLLIVCGAIGGWIIGSGLTTIGAISIYVTAFVVLLSAGVALSAWLPAIAPKPEDSIFSKGSSGGVQSLAGMLMALILTPLTIAVPAVLTSLASGTPGLIWAVPVVAALMSWGAVELAVLISGPVYDRRHAKILAHVSQA
ncbi:hypothetical protein EII31_00505 [Leucobacter sp. OH2974_COT-288]|nr:hypothetical protein EII31_00505 [Leucobacter sp. OH2974_COT-288]